MKLYKLISILGILLLLTPVLAVNIIQETDAGLEIFYPKVNYYPAESEIDIVIGVLNSTNALKTNTSTNCTLYIQYSNGTNLISGELMDFSEDYFKYSLNETQTSERGNYNYFVYCTNTVESGAFSGFFYINGTGEELSLETILLYLSLMGLLLGLFTFSVYRFIKDRDSFLSQFTFFNIGWYASTLLMWFIWNFILDYFYNYIFIGEIIKTISLVQIGIGWIIVPIDIVLLFAYVISNKIFKDLLEKGASSGEMDNSEHNWLFKYYWRRYK